MAEWVPPFLCAGSPPPCGFFGTYFAQNSGSTCNPARPYNQASPLYTSSCLTGTPIYACTNTAPGGLVPTQGEWPPLHLTLYTSKV